MTYFLKIKTFVFPVLTLLWRFAPPGNLPCSDELLRCPFSHERFPGSVVAIYNHFTLRNPDRPFFVCKGGCIMETVKKEGLKMVDIVEAINLYDTTLTKQEDKLRFLIEAFGGDIFGQDGFDCAAGSPFSYQFSYGLRTIFEEVADALRHYSEEINAIYDQDRAKFGEDEKRAPEPAPASEDSEAAT